MDTAKLTPAETTCRSARSRPATGAVLAVKSLAVLPAEGAHVEGMEARVEQRRADDRRHMETMEALKRQGAALEAVVRRLAPAER